MWLSRLSVAVCLVLAPGGRHALAAPPTATDVALRASSCRSASAGTQPSDFELRGVSLPLRRGVIVEDNPRFLRASFRGGRAPRLLRTWTEALRCGGWTVASKGARGPDAQALLTHVDHPDVVVITATGVRGTTELSIDRLPRLEVDAWLPVTLASPPLAPVGSELLRREGTETGHGRHLLHVVYPSSLTVAAVEDAWTAALTARGWRVDLIGGQRYFAGPDGVVALVVWRGVGAVELNLHRITAQGPRRETWRDLALPVMGVPASSLARNGEDELEIIVRCSEVHHGSGAARDVLDLHDRGLTSLGWRRVSGPLAASGAEPSTSVYRAGDRQVVATLSAPGASYCQSSHLTHRRFLSRSALGAPWADDDWPAMMGTSGIVVESTAGDGNMMATLVVVHRSELLGLGPASQAGCSALSRKLEAHWTKALRRRGWRPESPTDDLTFARRGETVDLEIFCDQGVATVSLSR